MWNYKIHFHVSGNPESSAIKFELFDKDRWTKDDFIGQVVMKFSDISSGSLSGNCFMWESRPHPHKDKVAGSLTALVKYSPGPKEQAPPGYKDLGSYHFQNTMFRPGPL